jgi:hypothetical protein
MFKQESIPNWLTRFLTGFETLLRLSCWAHATEHAYCAYVAIMCDDQISRPTWVLLPAATLTTRSFFCLSRSGRSALTTAASS